ncbi:MAG: hypothetical protein U0793_32945 [Gemmataceae bacterium]
MPWADFQRAVDATLASKRLGVPVFARLLVQHAATAKGAAALLAHLVAAANGWLDQPLQRIYALGAIKNRNVTLTLEYQRGATAQITWTGAAPHGSAVDLMLVGNHGAAYHDLAALAWDAPAAEPPKDLLAWVQRALESARPVEAP